MKTPTVCRARGRLVLDIERNNSPAVQSGERGRITKMEGRNMVMEIFGIGK